MASLWIISFVFFMLYVGRVTGQKSCIEFTKIGKVAHYSPLRLEYLLGKTDERFLMLLSCNTTTITSFKFKNGKANFITPCPPMYDCQWIGVDQTFVLTIENSTVDAHGDFPCQISGYDLYCEETKDLSLHVTGKASATVTSVTDGVLKEGQMYTIRCNITAGNPRTGIAYEWKRDGVTQAETGATLTISEVERSMDGTRYTCAADNGAGMGEHGAPLTLRVWYPPTPAESGESKILKGSTVTLGCIMADGNPRQLTGVQWWKDGSILSDQPTLSTSGASNILKGNTVEGGSVENPNLIIRHATEDDAGVYICVLKNEAGEGRSNHIHLEVSDGSGRVSVVLAIVGVVLLCALIAGIIVFVKRKRKNRKKSESGGKKKTCGEDPNAKQALMKKTPPV